MEWIQTREALKSIPLNYVTKMTRLGIITKLLKHKCLEFRILPWNMAEESSSGSEAIVMFTSLAQTT